MAAMNFSTSNQTFRQLLGNGLTYSVPRFQRDYSWTEEEWDDLWQDILGIVGPSGEEAHYMGYLVLRTADNKTFDIIDGQQRLTTLSILVLAILKNLQILIDQNIDPANNKRRLEQLRNSYIGYLDPVTLISKSKLSLNRNNNAYYQNYIVPFEKLPQRGIKTSENQLRKAFDWFKSSVSKEYIDLKDGAQLAKLIDIFADKLVFTVIIVTDELNAFKVFETLNARGVRLSATDLLKNYLFSVVYREDGDEHEIDSLENWWERITDKLNTENFPEFLRMHWNSRHSFVRQADLFKKIRKKIEGKGDVFKLLRHMDEDVDIFVALLHPEDQFWTSEQRQYINELNLFKIRQPFSLLIAAYRGVDPQAFTNVLHACSIISFRSHTIAGQTTNDQERVYNSVAERIAQGELKNAKDIIYQLRSLYLSDDQFRNAFSDKQIRTTQSRNRQLIRYILFAIENHYTKAEYDIESDKYSIEHILPESMIKRENPKLQWAMFTDEQIEQFVYRLGNMTLLDSSENRNIGQQEYIPKRPIYANSVIGITKKIAEENNEWTVSRIAERQNWMAKQATAIWRISQLT